MQKNTIDSSSKQNHCKQKHHIVIQSTSYKRRQNTKRKQEAEHKWNAWHYDQHRRAPNECLCDCPLPMSDDILNIIIKSKRRNNEKEDREKKTHKPEAHYL